MLTIPLQPVPSQTLSVTVASQAAQINVYQLGSPDNHQMYFDLLNNGVPVVTGRVIRGYGGIPETAAAFLLEDAGYQGFPGDFLMIDTQATPTQDPEDPQPSGLGSRWQLLYLEASDFE